MWSTYALSAFCLNELPHHKRKLFRLWLFFIAFSKDIESARHSCLSNLVNLGDYRIHFSCKEYSRMHAGFHWRSKQGTLLTILLYTNIHKSWFFFAADLYFESNEKWKCKQTVNWSKRDVLLNTRAWDGTCAILKKEIE